ncbi:Trehalose utilization [Symmachiella dynata]|uniref:ThuA domain-containing protein n=1 Tax=Symmachiella dynata TaxID=2527995 RepID=UPI00118CC1D8|nr:ThuA domain-containing protein [Symmachiella dynata]QDT51352.1 Trehalose utilization [Symmachiella dynata]
MLTRLPFLCCLLIAAVFCAALPDSAVAEETAKPKRLLLIGQGPDNHKPTTHEYMAGMQVVAHLLQGVDGLQTIITKADEPWAEGPELLDGADGVVLFVSQGAKWLSQNPERLAAFERLAQRGGGFSVLHWGMGTREAADIASFVNLFGGCHGGPDRKYKFLTTTMSVADGQHPITRGLETLELEEEFYYQLKFPKPPTKITPLIKARIDDQDETVSWAWQRPNGGRSFGFSGLHFHDNWKQDTYRRLFKQGILWTLKYPIPEKGTDVAVEASVLELKPRK